MTKQISISQSLNWHVAGDLGLTSLLEPFLMRSLHDETGLMTFFSHVRCHVLGFREIIFRELILEFFSYCPV